MNMPKMERRRRLARTERSKVDVLRSLEAIQRRTAQAIAKVDPSAAELLASGAAASVKHVEASRIIAEMFVAQPEAMAYFQTDSVARVVADALATILGRPFHIIHEPRMGDLGQYSIGEGAR